MHARSCHREEELENKKKALQEAEGMAKRYLSLGHKTLEFLAYISEGPAAAPFLASVFIVRMATMLNSFIDKLAGSKMGEIKVRNPEELGFEPLKLLELTATVLTHMFLHPLGQPDASQG